MPAHGGSTLGIPAETVNVRLQLSMTVGGTGTVAAAVQAIVNEPPAGIVTTGALIVYV